MTEPTPDKTPAGTGPGYLLTIIISLVVSMITAITTVAVYDQRYAQKVVAMDLKGYIRQQRDRMIAGELNEEQGIVNLV